MAIKTVRERERERTDPEKHWVWDQSVGLSRKTDYEGLGMLNVMIMLIW